MASLRSLAEKAYPDARERTEKVVEKLEDQLYALEDVQRAYEESDEALQALANSAQIPLSFLKKIGAEAGWRVGGWLNASSAIVVTNNIAGDVSGGNFGVGPVDTARSTTQGAATRTTDDDQRRRRVREVPMVELCFQLRSFHVAIDGALFEVDKGSFAKDENGEYALIVYVDGQDDPVELVPRQAAKEFAELALGFGDYADHVSYMKHHLQVLMDKARISQETVGRLAGVFHKYENGAISQGRVSSFLLGYADKADGYYLPMVALANFAHMSDFADVEDDIFSGDNLKAVLGFGGTIENAKKREPAKQPSAKYEFSTKFHKEQLLLRARKEADSKVKAAKAVGRDPPKTLTLDGQARAKVMSAIHLQCKHAVEHGTADQAAQRVAKRGKSFTSSPRNDTFTKRLWSRIPKGEKDRILENAEAANADSTRD